MDNPDFRAMTFFGGGGLLLTAALAGSSMWMRRTRHAVVNGRGLPALAQLGARNAARNPARSLLTAALLAAAAFLLVAVESFRRQPDKEFLEKTGGSGGFNLIAETDVPLFQPFDSGPGRADLEKQLKRAYAPKDGDPDAPPETPAYLAAEGRTRRRAPRGVPAAAPRRRRRELHEPVPGRPAARARRAGVAHRPRRLQVLRRHSRRRQKRRRTRGCCSKTVDKGGAIPVFCEQNTAQWMLKTAVGGEFTMPGDDGAVVHFRHRRHAGR